MFIPAFHKKYRKKLWWDAIHLSFEIGDDDFFYSIKNKYFVIIP